MLRVFSAFLLILVATSSGSTVSYAGQCPGTYSEQTWTNCVGTTYFGGDMYVGGFKDGQPYGHGTATYASGETFVGEWGCQDVEPYLARCRSSRIKGKVTYTNGDTYDGEWTGYGNGENYPEGQGTYTSYKGSNLEEELRPLAEKGNAKAQKNLGLAYKLGRGAPQNDIRAYIWLSLAAQQGDENAKKARIELEDKMSPAQIDWAKKLSESQVGNCVRSAIDEITSFFGNPFSNGHGTIISYDNYSSHVSYDQPEAVTKSKVGDPVRICLREVPRDCPLGDSRGKSFETTNERTNESWVMSDSKHGCGGA
jgi:hypothetical protein